MTDIADNDKLQIKAEDLKYLKRDLLAAVFNETHAELLLYQKGRCFQIARNNKTKTRLQKSVIKANHEPMPDAEILEDIKFDKELDGLRHIFKVAYDTLTTEAKDQDNPYKELLEVVEAQNQSSNEIEKLTHELSENTAALNNFKDEQIKLENEISEKLARKTQCVRELREQLTNVKRINRLEQRLVKKWEDNRLNQAMIVGEKRERILMQEIVDLQRLIGGEKRLICEVTAFRNDEISELKTRIEEQHENFRRETTKIDEENAKLTQKIADIEKNHEKLREITQQRKTFVAEYLQQKAEEQRLYEEQRYRVECAIRLQAWWRGVMVRNGLGPYRKKSKKGKKSKDKNKLKQNN